VGPQANFIDHHRRHRDRIPARPRPVLDDEPEVSPPPTGEVVEIHSDELDRAPDVVPGGAVTLDSGEPLACAFHLDCLMEQVEAASGRPPPVAASPEPVMPPDTVPTKLPPAAWPAASST
jgi:hypothetical protein